jgi:hypothetical protein
MISPSSLKHYGGMIRRLLALFALLTLALMSAAVAHEHGMGQRHMAAPAEAAARHATVRLTMTDTSHHALGRPALREASSCSDTGKPHHNHGKQPGCACPAACAGLFDLAVAAPPVADEASAGIPADMRRLSATSAPPPTPPPRA